MMPSLIGRRVLAYAQPVDMRKGFDGLYGLVREELDEDPLSGDLFLFVSRNRLRAKVLVWDGTGLCLYSKRLETGRFAPLWRRAGEDGVVHLSTSELQLFLEGCHLVATERLSPFPLDTKSLVAAADLDTFGAWPRRPSSSRPPAESPPAP
jgi:transposase